MPKRPRSHEIEQLSRNRLHEIFNKHGWVIWDLSPDYGEDLLVRVFNDKNATQYSFFVQAKSTDHLERYIDREGKFINFPIDVDHLEYWGKFWEPVVLTLWDAKLDVTYWEIIQNCFSSNEEQVSYRKSFRVPIPITNTLDDNGLKSILRQTKLRFERFERIRAGVKALTGYIEKEINVKVAYDPGEEIISFHYSSKKTEEKPHLDFIILGDIAEKITILARYMNKDPEQFALELLKKKVGVVDVNEEM